MAGRRFNTDWLLWALFIAFFLLMSLVYAYGKGRDRACFEAGYVESTEIAGSHYCYRMLDGQLDVIPVPDGR